MIVMKKYEKVSVKGFCSILFKNMEAHDQKNKMAYLAWLPCATMPLYSFSNNQKTVFLYPRS